MHQFSRFALALVLVVGSVVPAYAALAAQGEPADLPGPQPEPDWRTQGGQSEANLGHAVAAAGDVNGDGYADIMIGTPMYDGGQADEGRVCVYYGSPEGPLPDPWIVEGNQAGARLGASLSTAGDVNGDGYDDVILGAPGYDGAHPDAGSVRIYLGSAAGLATAPARILEGETQDDEYGFSVGCAGDVNGDGHSDIIVGAPGFPAPGYGHGKAYVYCGGAAGLPATPCWEMPGEPGSASRYGYAVAGAGDVNGDGFDDVIMGAPSVAGKGGRVLVFYGRAAGLGLSPWIYPSGSTYGEVWLGASVASAGDLNGDAFDDVIVGTPLYGGDYQGVITVFFGSAGGAAGTWGRWLSERSSRFGCSVASAGDVNGDGYSDLLVGASSLDSGVSGQGAAFLYVGSAGLP